MGVYLSSPVTDKISFDNSCKNFSYGASSMQGWRMTQEDAHNCIPEFDHVGEENEGAFFAVYDGHGGAEVAQYCAMHFPDYLKGLESYKNNSVKQALEDAFLGFDATLIQEATVKELKLLAGEDDNNAEDDDGADVSVGQTEADLLRAEANMPLDELLSKYENVPGAVTRDVRKKENIHSPMIRPRRPVFAGGDGEDVDESRDTEKDNQESLSLESNENNSSLSRIPVATNLENKLTNGHADNENNLNKEKEILDSINQQSRNKGTNSASADVETELSVLDSGGSLIKEEEIKDSEKKMEEVESRSCAQTEKSQPSASVSEGTILSESSSDGATEPSKSAADGGGAEHSGSAAGEDTQPCSSGAASSSGSSSNTDGSSKGPSVPMEADSDDSDDDEEDEEYEESEEDDEDEEDEEEEEEEDKQTDEVEPHCMDMSNEEPGSDSGCTACVALLSGKQLYVANAGDSRCVLSREGKAVDLSFDHKPEDEPERLRIEKAGGKVTSDGRVNGGLNLSRAIGDHFYKRNHDLSPREQMITALPDIKTITLDDRDEFMVLACDGIWNFMSSQEVVDMVRKKLKDPEKKTKISIICEELFDYCLAPNTFGDGTGCDNMSCIIVLFKSEFKDGNMCANNKRCANEMESNCDVDQQIEKRAKVNSEISEGEAEEEA